MDTPDKITQPSPSSFLNKFEDSPVFNYISALSPIKTFKLSHSAQSFSLLGLASPQSLQTPPPTNSLKESEIKSGCNVSDAPENNISQDDSKSVISETSGAAQAADLQIKGQGKLLSGPEETVRPIEESFRLVKDLPISVKYECASPESDLGHCGAVKPDCEFDVAKPEIFPAEVRQVVCKESEDSLDNERSMQGIEAEHSRDVGEWENFIYEDSDIFNCYSPTVETHQEAMHDKNLDSGSLSFVTEVLQTPDGNIDDSQKMDSPYISTESNEEAGKQNELSQVSPVKAHSVFAEEFIQYSRTETDDKSSSQQQQTKLRRCLVYEMSGSHYRKILSDPVGGSPISMSAARSKTSTEKSFVASKPESSKFSSPFPGIGLHLNALAAGGGEKIIVKRQTLTCRRQLISSPASISSMESLTPTTKIVNGPVIPEVVERGAEEQRDFLNGKKRTDSPQLNEDVCETTAFDDGVEFPQSSHKKKRKRSDNSGGMDSCKRCNCKRSKCLKLYCECFAAGLYCVEPCNCQDCFNKPAHEDTVLETRRQIESRNPLAFAPKVISFSRTQSIGDEPIKTPASARHKRGCNCKKSGCLKKYCECFQGGVGCSLSCRCEGCKNTFGRKEGIDGIIFEEAKVLKKSASEISAHHEVLKTEDQNEATEEPSDNARQPVRQPFHFDSIGPRSPLLPCAQSLQSCSIPENNILNQPALEETHTTVLDDESSDVLTGDYLLPTTNVKSTSPNSKRISPHHDFEPSLGWKSCRKLILRSIPSFPTVSNEKESIEKLQ